MTKFLKFNILPLFQTNEVRQVSHFRFNSWPDFGVPHSAVAMLDFLGKVRKCQSSMLQDLGDKWAGHQRGPPIVVHCSAGIGRTGKILFYLLSIAKKH